jgi:hypothetical protein
MTETRQEPKEAAIKIDMEEAEATDFEANSEEIESES